MDFTGQFRLDEDSMAINIFQTPIKGLVQGMFQILHLHFVQYITCYGGIFSRLYFNFVTKKYIFRFRGQLQFISKHKQEIICLD
ncbi:unnamed protein product [Paramecium primaurelia]|uniref:Uncharacterized protein n=1 Tax=Paramecium primaurelia TaxID=5886 RepID=A0A8S1L4J2_PARPR|nr:unnamed protein product [Paramecium primaurelia]